MGSKKSKVEVAGIMSTNWFIGWLFTIGFVKPSFWKGLLVLLLWSYYPGEKLAM